MTNKTAARIAALEATLANDSDVMTVEQRAEIARAIARLRGNPPVAHDRRSGVCERCGHTFAECVSADTCDRNLAKAAKPEPLKLAGGFVTSAVGTGERTYGPAPIVKPATSSAPESPKVAAENAKRVAAGKPKMTAAEAREFETFSVTNAEIVESACENGCEAYKDVFTFNRWIAQGMVVRKGQKATKITVWTKREIVNRSGERETIRTPRQVPVFCRCQVKRLEAKAKRAA